SMPRTPPEHVPGPRRAGQIGGLSRPRCGAGRAWPASRQTATGLAVCWRGIVNWCGEPQNGALPSCPRTRMEKRYNIAIAGATGAVGEALLSILAERRFPVGELVPLASERSAGDKVAFGARSVTVRQLDGFDFAGIDIAFFSAGAAVSAEHAPRAAAAGAVVIDNTSQFRYEADVPLVVAEVNPEALAARPRGIVANPNCSTMQLVVALAPLHRAA